MRGPKHATAEDEAFGFDVLGAADMGEESLRQESDAA